MKRMRLLLTICLFSFLTISTYAGRTTFGETRISLDGFWQFKTDPLLKGENARWYSPDFNDKTWDKMEVPGSWELMNETANYIGTAWYRTTFKMPEVSWDKRFFLEFEAVSMSYKVYVNGKLVVNQAVGNFCERYDISGLLQKTGENVLAVEVDNRLCWGAYINWGGIRRPVTLCAVEPVFIERQEVVSVPDLAKGTAEVNVRVFIRNNSGKEQTVKCLANLEFDGKLATKSINQMVKVPSNGSETALIKFKLSKAQTKLWHFDRPNLYTSEVTLLDGERKLGSYTDRFGIRKIALEGYQLKLNGEPVRLAGLNWVADDRTTGNTLPAWRYKEDIDRMKSLGANMARLSHRPLPDEVLDYLDEKGFLVISEFNNRAQFINADSAEPREFATKLIHQQFNHPCVIAWSVGNEMGEQKAHTNVNGYVESIIRYIKQNLDSTRLVSYVSNTADSQADDAAKYCDMIWINKYGNYEKAVDYLARTFPGKAIFMTEYGGYGIEAGNLIYDTPNNTAYKKFNVDNLKANKYLTGYSMWTFDDYRSRYQSLNLFSSTPVHQNRQWGVVDVYRNKKRAYNQMKDFYAPIGSLDVKMTPNGNQMSVNMVLQPRKMLDIPSFKLKDYRLIWEVLARDGITRNGGVIQLPEIAPGTSALNYTSNFIQSDESAFLKVTLLSSTGYNVKDTTIYLARPEPPKVVAVIPASRSVRVVFEKNDFSAEYVLKYTIKGELKTTAPTIDHYIDITGLAADVPCLISVAGINGAGEGTPSKPVTVIPKYGTKSLPPVIWLTEPCNNGCTIGMGYVFTDQFYEVRCTETPADSASWKLIPATVFGSFRVSELENGRKYYLQMRSIPQGGGTPSEWSEMLTATPGTTALRGEAKVKGILQQNGETILLVSPAKNASEYKITYETDGRQVEELVNQSEIEYVLLRKVGKSGVKNLTIKAF